MLAEMARQDQLANDLANASTPGYKADRVSQRSFGDLMLSNSTDGSVIGPLGAGAAIDKQVTDVRPQAMRATGQPLDLAVEGDGWFGVQTKQGVRYTRNGAFTTDAQGFLTTAQGDRVLGKNGQPLNLSGGEKVSIARNGDVHVGNRLVGTVGVIALQPNSLRKEGDNYLTGTVDPTAKVGMVAQGALESSNVNTVKEMVSLIENMREFEADQKMIRAIDDTLGGAVNQVGRV